MAHAPVHEAAGDCELSPLDVRVTEGATERTDGPSTPALSVAAGFAYGCPLHKFNAQDAVLRHSALGVRQLHNHL